MSKRKRDRLDWTHAAELWNRLTKQKHLMTRASYWKKQPPSLPPVKLGSPAE